jgi:hypothetical protein
VDAASAPFAQAAQPGAARAGDQAAALPCMRGAPLLRAPRMLAPAEVDAVLTNRDRAIARIRLKFADNCTSFFIGINQCYYSFIRVFQK